MAVDWFRERWHGRASSDELEHDQREYVRSFQAHTTDPKDGPKEVLAHTNCPKKGDGYRTDTEQDPYALCTRRRVTNDAENPNLFEIVVDYSTRQPEQDEPGDNPLLRPAEITGDSEIVQKALQWAYARDIYVASDPSTPIDSREGPLAIVNTALQPFDPPPTVDWDIDVLTITKNLDITISDLQALRRQFRRKTNLGYFLGYPAHHVKVGSLNYTNAKEKGIKFKRVTLKLSFSDDGFFYEPMNAGYWELQSSKYVEIVDDNGQRPSTPHPLSLSGAKLVTTDPLAILYCRFQILKQAALAPLLTLMGFEE